MSFFVRTLKILCLDIHFFKTCECSRFVSHNNMFVHKPHTWNYDWLNHWCVIGGKPPITWRQTWVSPLNVIWEMNVGKSLFSSNCYVSCRQVSRLLWELQDHGVLEHRGQNYGFAQIWFPCGQSMQTASMTLLLWGSLPLPIAVL